MNCWAPATAFGFRAEAYLDPNYYWIQVMGRLRPGVSAGAGPGRAGAAVSAMGDGDRRPTTGSARIFPSWSSTTAAGGLDTLRRRVLAAALCADDAGGIDPGAGVRQRRQPAAGARRGEKARDRAAPERGRGPVSRRAATADRERAAGVAGRRSGRVVRDLGDSLPDSAAGQRPGELHSARGIELARAGRRRPHFRC